MMKEKERLHKNQARQVKANRDLNTGYKIKVSSSQIFEHSPGDNSYKEDTEDLKDLLGIDDTSSPRSSGRRNSHFITPNKMDDYKGDSKQGTGEHTYIFLSLTMCF